MAGDVSLKDQYHELLGIISDLFAPDGHRDGCLFKADHNMPCQCDYPDRMARYRAAIVRAKEIAALRSQP